MRLAYGCRTLSWLLLLLLLSTAAATTVYVSNSSTSSNTTSFIDALKDPAVTNIVLKDDYYSVEHSFAPHMPGGGSGAITVTRYAAVVGSRSSRNLSRCCHLLHDVARDILRYMLASRCSGHSLTSAYA
jgi:hypothetical protein